MADKYLGKDDPLVFKVQVPLHLMSRLSVRREHDDFRLLMSLIKEEVVQDLSELLELRVFHGGARIFYVGGDIFELLGAFHVSEEGEVLLFLLR